MEAHATEPLLPHADSGGLVNAATRGSKLKSMEREGWMWRHAGTVQQRAHKFVIYKMNGGRKPTRGKGRKPNKPRRVRNLVPYV